jgi:hypothetical protein
VEYRQHHYLLRLDLVEDRIRKALHYDTADISEYLRIPLWRGAGPVEDLLHLRDEIHAESRPLLLVPIERLVERGPGFRPQDDR